MKKITLFILYLSLGFFWACQKEKTSSLKLMSYNIRHGVGMDSILDLSRAAEVIKAQAPDLCALQEIDNFCTRSDSVGQTEYLAEKTGMEGIFGKFMDYQGGQYGMATLSAKPLLWTKLLQLPDGIYEPRFAIIQEVHIAEGCTVVFANVHLDWIEGKQGVSSRLKQAETLMGFLDQLHQAIIITGDFNCEPDSPTMQFFQDQGFDLVEKGSDNLSFQGPEKAEIDHLLFRSSKRVKLKLKGTGLLDEPVVSDHRPLIADLEVIHKD